MRGKSWEPLISMKTFNERFFINRRSFLPHITDRFLSKTCTSYRLKSSPSLLQPVWMSFMVPTSTIALTWSLFQPGTGMIQVLGEIRRQFIAVTTEVIIQASIKIYQQYHPLSPFRPDLVKIWSNLIKEMGILLCVFMTFADDYFSYC